MITVNYIFVKFPLPFASDLAVYILIRGFKPRIFYNDNYPAYFFLITTSYPSSTFTSETGSFPVILHQLGKSLSTPVSVGKDPLFPGLLEKQ